MHRPFLIRAFPILAGAVIVSWVLILTCSDGSPDRNRVLSWAVLIMFLPYALAGHHSEQTWKKVLECFDLEDYETDEVPDWVRAQWEKNRKKRSVFTLASILVIVLLFCPLEGWEVGFIGFAALNLAFQSGMYIGAYLVMVAQARLLRDVEGWSNKPDAGWADDEV